MSAHVREPLCIAPTETRTPAELADRWCWRCLGSGQYSVARLTDGEWNAKLIPCRCASRPSPDGEQGAQGGNV